MASVSASHLVIFIASLVVAAGVAGTLVTEVDRVSQSITDQSDDMAENIEADIQIISDTGQAGSIHNSTEGNLTLLVKNVGGTDVEARSDRVDLLVEGRFITPDHVTVELVESNITTWTPGTVIRIEADTEAAGVTINGETRVSVAVGDNKDTIRFRA
jgi:flagellar protein FlaG